MERLRMSAPDWFRSLLARPEITDLCLNGADLAFADSGNGMERIDGARWDEAGIRQWVIERLSEAGKSWDARHPFVDASWAEPSFNAEFRLHAAFPPLARNGILVSIRRLARPLVSGAPGGSSAPMPDAARWAGSPHYERLREIVRSGETLLLSGATGSGKTTLASDLLAEVPPAERIIALEDTPELAPAHPHFLTLLSRPANADGHGEVSLRALLRQTLRMRPDRIVLGECRGDEVLELLQALNTGHRGALATLHANSPRDALRRIELLCLLASRGTLPVGVIRELLATGVRWVAQVRRNGARREISELTRIEGREGDTLLLRPVLT